MLTAAAAIVRKTTTAERGAKEFHPRSLPFVSLSPLLSSPLPFLRPASFCGLCAEKIYEAVFCRSDIGIISVESNGAGDDEKAAARREAKKRGRNFPSWPLAPSTLN